MCKRISIYLIGLIISALGIALMIRSMAGTGPWDSFAVGIKMHVGLTIGFWAIITQGSLVFATAFFEKARPRLEAILVVFVRSLFLDIWYYLVLDHFQSPTTLLLQWLVFITGLLLVGLGIGVYIEAKFPRSPTDQLMIVLSERFNWSYTNSRLLIESVGAALGLLVGGPVGLGTVIIALTLGKIIQLSNRYSKKFIGEVKVSSFSN